MQQWVIEIRILPAVDVMYLRIYPKLILFLTTKRRRDNIYCDISGKIFYILKYYLHKSLIPTSMTVLIIFFFSL